MESNRNSFNFFDKNNKNLDKINHPCLFYIEKNNTIDKQNFYILGTLHSLSVNLFSTEIIHILTNQEKLWCEHLFLVEAISEDCTFFIIDKSKKNNLLHWLDKINPSIQAKLLAVFPDLETNLYSRIHPKFYFIQIMLNIFNYSKNGKMDNQLRFVYRNANKSIFYLETYEETIEALLQIITIGLNTINSFFGDDDINDFPNNLDNFDLENANDWASLFNFFLQPNYYQEYFTAYHQALTTTKQNEKYIYKPPIITDTPSSLSSDLRSKIWYEKHINQINNALIICGHNHVLKGENGLLKKLIENEYQIYHINNQGKKVVFNLAVNKKTNIINNII